MSGPPPYSGQPGQGPQPGPYPPFQGPPAQGPPAQGPPALGPPVQGPAPYGQGQYSHGAADPGHRPAQKNMNGVIAGMIAAIVIVGGTGTAIALASNSHEPAVAVSGVPSTLPSGHHLPSGSSLPSGVTSVPGGSSIPSSLTSTVAPPGNSTSEYTADSAGYDYFTALDDNSYDSARDLFCDPSSFPLDQTDVADVQIAYSNGPSTGNDSSATMTGQVNLVDSTSYAITLYLDAQSDSTWCVDHMVSQQN